MRKYDFNLLRNKIFFKGIVYGTQDYECKNILLDTGAVVTILHQDIASYLGYDLSPKKTTKTMNLQTPNGAMQAKIIKLDRFELLGLDLRNVEIAVLPFKPMFAVDILLGMDYLSNYLDKFTLDLPNKQITIY